MLPSTNTTPTISHIQLSELTGKRQDNVKRTIETLSKAGVISSPQIEDGIKGKNGVTPKIIFVNERDSYIVVAQLCPEYTAKLVDHWMATKNTEPQLPTSFAEALQLAADQAKQLELAAPKVAFVDRYVESTGNKTFREVCKLLQANERKIRAMLISEDVMYNLNGSWTVKAYYLGQGYFNVNAGEANGHAYNAVKFTPRGVEWVSRKWGKFNGSLI